MTESKDIQNAKEFHSAMVRSGLEAVEDLSGFEKKLLRQHILLSEMTNLSWRLAEKVDAIIIGTTDGAEKVHRAWIIGQKIKEDQGELPFFITSGSIGITVHESKKLGIPGVSARVLAAQLEDYGVPKEKIIVEDKSKHTQEQAKIIGEIAKERGLKNFVNVVGFWHSPRFYMTFINQNPDLDLYTTVVSRDTHRVGRAPFGLTGYPFEVPTQIAEVARLHKYYEEDIGPTDPDGLMSYISRLLKDNPELLGKKRKVFTEVNKLWKETHNEAMARSEELLVLR